MNEAAFEGELEQAVATFGAEILERVREQQLSTFNREYWSGRVLAWAMAHPDLKVSLFRLIDVLPALRSSVAVSRHIQEYLGPAVDDFGRMVAWGLKADPHSIRSRIAALGVRQGVQKVAGQFIAGETPEEGLSRLRSIRKRGMCFTVDLLGEFSTSEVEAEHYLHRYQQALGVLGNKLRDDKAAVPLIPGHPGEAGPVCVSIKLSALYSQCSVLNIERSTEILAERLSSIARLARSVNGTLYVDAEDKASNAVIYPVFKKVFSSPEFRDLPYPGIVVQAYAKDSPLLVEDLLQFARRRGAPIAVRLVKGAYWDYETILCNQNNWESPLFSVKESSDANFESLARLLIDNHELCLPAFASHNVRSLSHACCYAAKRGLDFKQLELQMLYGMADPIARAFRDKGYLVRLYVPLGQLIPGMGYFVRRLLENTSNESFLRHTFFENEQIKELLRKPVMRG